MFYKYRVDSQNHHRKVIFFCFCMLIFLFHCIERFNIDTNIVAPLIYNLSYIIYLTMISAGALQTSTGTTTFSLSIQAFFQQWPGLHAESWQSICTTWDSESELVQLWLNGKPSIKKFIGGLVITDPVEQDSHGGGFDINQCFVGMMSDVHLNFTPGNVINWRALEFEATGRVLVENKLTCE
uniref:Pentraxin (PTX) domain-containing protein n=1 Tax=Pundamilia nyererei TaxID=303518 RepID=A0A3B4GJ63_9CICH